MFKLNEKLAQDSYLIADLKISQLLLAKNANYPWFILVVKKENLVELIDLSLEQQIEVLKEINFISKFLKDDLKVDKINIATLGNVVKQLHIHIIGRFENDPAFPKPIWCKNDFKEYQEEDLENLIIKIRPKINKILSSK
jgi:diadenosine tetraphosphate (Ap4A) HIT family hydrolase